MDSADQNLTRRATASSIWMIAARLVVRFSDLLLLMLLTRLLAPSDFGLVAIAVSVVAILDVVTDLPLATPLVRLEKPSKVHMDTAFVLGILRGLLIFAAAVVLAQPVATFFGDPRLAPLMLVLAAGSALYNLRSPRMAILFKRLEFRQSFIVEVGGKMVGLIAAIIGAFWLESYWALTISPVVSRSMSVLLSYRYAPYQPGLSLREWRYFWEFLSWMIPSQFIIALSWQFDRLFLGRVIPIEQLGFYSVASTVTSIIEQTVRRAVTGPLISGFVLASTDPARLRRGYLLADNAIFSLGAPVYVGTFCLADPMVRLAFGQDWIVAAPFLGGLALAMLPALVRIPFRPLAMAAGQTRYVFIIAVWSLALRIPAVTGGYAFGGVQGVILGIGLANIGNALVAMFCVRKVVEGLTFGVQMSANGRTLVALLPMFIFTWWAGSEMDDMPIGATLVAVFLGVSLLTIVIHAASVLFVWRLSGRPDGIESRAFATLRKRTMPSNAS